MSTNIQPVNSTYFKCNCCYEQVGTYILLCTCLYCRNCVKNLYSSEKKCCKVCNKPCDFSKVVDLNKKENHAKYSYMFADPDMIIKKGFESLIFQKNYNKKYIEYLKAKSEIAIEASKPDRSGTPTIRDPNRNHPELTSTIYNIKRVSPKPDQYLVNNNSIKQKEYKVENLNARTVNSINNVNILQTETRHDVNDKRKNILNPSLVGIKLYIL